jgi:hypothetical protein
VTAATWTTRRDPNGTSPRIAGVTVRPLFLACIWIIVNNSLALEVVNFCTDAVCLKVTFLVGQKISQLSSTLHERPRIASFNGYHGVVSLDGHFCETSSFLLPATWFLCLVGLVARSRPMATTDRILSSLPVDAAIDASLTPAPTKWPLDGQGSHSPLMRLRKSIRRLLQLSLDMSSPFAIASTMTR